MTKAEFAEQRAELVCSIGRDEENVRTAVQELTGVARSKLDVGGHIKKFPMTWAIGAFVVGIWLGKRRAS